MSGVVRRPFQRFCGNVLIATKFDLSHDMKERLTKIAASRKRYTVGKLIATVVKQVYGRGSL